MVVALGNAVSALFIPLAVFGWTLNSPNLDSFGNIRMNDSSTYDRLTTRILSKIMELSSSNDDTTTKTNQQYWIAIAGGAGAGKTTVASTIRDRLNQIGDSSTNISSSPHQSDPSAVVVPMDGFHYTQDVLKSLHGPDAMRRRGAPWTFDAEQLVQTLTQVKRQKRGKLPLYSREISDPIPGGIEIHPWHRVILVEGLYLLHQKDPRYAPLMSLWDETWFVKAPDPEQRSLLTWSPSKTQQWGPGVEGATKRAKENDSLNSQCIAYCEQLADDVIVTI
jgi:pantothenate kinase